MMIIDQGPLFHLISIRARFDRWEHLPVLLQQWWTANFDRILGTISGIVFLKISHSLCLQRVRIRPVPHQLKNLQSSQGFYFLRQYEALYQETEKRSHAIGCPLLPLESEACLNDWLRLFGDWATQINSMPRYRASAS
ncbi:MAG: hypothetical protein AAF514_22960 [Verrucomicrobiota bacterium]